MSRWQDVGVVQDSDDEGALESITTLSSPLRQPISQDLTARDGLGPDSRSDGFGIEPERVGGRPDSIHQDNENTVFDLAFLSSDSELSDVPEDFQSPRPSPTRRLPSVQVLVQQRAPRPAGNTSSSSSRLSSPPLSPLSQLQDDDDLLSIQQAQLLSDHQQARLLSEAPRRTFRKRNDIQLHPYLLEQQQYLRQCLARGVKPVRVRFEDSRGAQAAVPEQTETQDETRQASQSSQSSEGLWRLDSSASESQARARQALSSSSQPDDAPAAYADDELPDISDILRSRASTKVQVGNKRRKISSTLRIGNAPVEHDQSGALFDFPGSPKSQSIEMNNETNIPARVDFHVPRTLAPTVQTPASTSRPQRSNLIALDDSEDEPVVLARSTGRRSGRSSDRVAASRRSTPVASSDDGSESEASEILRVQRRIKGVLPASWLRLDLEAQTKRRRPLTSPDRDRGATQHEPSRGVAKKVIRPQAKIYEANATTPVAFDINGDSDEDSQDRPPAASPPRPVTTPEKHQRHLLESIFLDDIEEDNGVDAMLPARPRGPRRPKPGIYRDKKQQSKLTEVYGYGKQHKQSSGKRPQSRPSSKLPGQPTKRKHRPPRFRAPRLSILDAEESGDAASEDPQFVRLAKRAARQQEDLGRVSPGSKFIRLQTAEDTEDAHTVLKRWKQGSIRPRNGPRQQRAKTAARPALAAKSHNIQPTLPYSVEAHRSEIHLDDEEAFIVRRPQTSAAAKNLRQSRLDAKAVDRAPAATATAEQKDHRAADKTTLAQPRQDRRVLAKRMGIRAAQLEAPALPDSLPEEDFTLARFLQQAQLRRSRPQASIHTIDADDESLPSTDRSLYTTDEARIAQQAEAIQIQPPKKIIRRLRKRPGRQVDAAAKEFGQLLQPVLPAVAREAIIEIHGQSPAGSTGLHGLPPAGTSLTVNFDKARLPSGKYFDDDTFIGSGELDACMHLVHRDIGLAQPAHTIPSSDGDDRWSAWNERVAGEFRTAITRICLLLEGCQDSSASGDPEAALSLLRHVVKYVATSLSFTDPVDCESFLRCVEEQTKLLRDTLSGTANRSARDSQASCLMLLLALQCMACHVARVTQQRNVDGLERSTIQSAQTIVTTWSQTAADVRNLPGHVRNEDASGIGADESIVATHHLLDAFQLADTNIWSLLNAVWQLILRDEVNFATFEEGWARLFSVISFLGCTRTGLVDNTISYRVDWSNPKALITRVLSLYADTTGQTASLNAYVRTLLVRCYHLLVYWRWECPESVLYAWFDFFATRKLSGLRLEDTNGSMQTLESLHEYPDWEPASNDSTFQMFLKLLAKGLLSLRTSHSDRKIQGIVWRFVPAHGRTYPKESSLAQDDLNALRNHHDLLSVLYWASPARHRPRLNLIRDLVDHSTSHREACRLSVRAWSNLVRYQSSTDEPEEALAPFISWVRDILTKTLAQYRMAKSEAETQQANWKAQGDKQFTFEYVNRVVDRNQRQVLATLSETINGLQSAILVAATEQNLIALVRDSSIAGVLSLCTERSTSISNVMTEVFALYQTYLRRWDEFPSAQKSSPANEESQEYGEWPELDVDLDDVDLDITEVSTGASPASPKPLDLVAEPVQQYLANVLGMLDSPDVPSTEAAMKTLVSVAKLRIDANDSDWSSYLDPHGAHSWHRLTDTRHARKFGPLFYALAIECDPQRVIAASNTLTTVGPHDEAIYSIWLTSLVEQDVNFGYQNRLTEALLNNSSATEGTLLHNLPFWTRSSTSMNIACPPGKGYSITLHEIRERRSSLLGTVLANMRRAYHNSLRHGDQGMHKRLLKRIMTAMKANFLALGSNDIEQGKYVTFVHALLGLFIQHTSEICPVDSFFTDGLVFPLAAEDPTYVVAKLRSYRPKLGTAKAQKEFATFLHNLLQQAVSGGQRAALTFASRFESVVAEGLVHAHGGTMSMATVVVGGMLPAYLADCFTTTTRHSIVQTFLSIVTHSFRDILTQVSVSKERIDGALGMLIADFLDAASISVLPALEDPKILGNDGATQTLALLVDAVESLAPAIDYMVRLRLLSSEVWRCMDLLTLCFNRLADWDTIDTSSSAPLIHQINEQSLRRTERFRDLRQFTQRCIRQGSQDVKSTAKTWECLALERLELRHAIDQLMSTTERLTSKRGGRKKHRIGFAQGLTAV